MDTRRSATRFAVLGLLPFVCVVLKGESARYVVAPRVATERGTADGRTLLRVTLLTGEPRGGTTGPDAGPSVLVVAGSDTLLFDCEPPVPARLNQLGVRIADVTAVFLTRLDASVVEGLRALRLTDGESLPRQMPLQIWGPVGTRVVMKGIYPALDVHPQLQRGRYETGFSNRLTFTVTDLQPGVVSEPDGVTVMALPGDPSLESSSLGYRVDHRGHSVVIGIGAHARPQTLQSLKHVDVMLLRQPEALLASKTFADVNPRLAVLSWRGASDPRRAVRQHYAGPLELAEDMMTIDVNEQIEIRRQTR